MAHFYGTLQGHRGQASRLGTKSSGLRVTAASWSGAVSVDLDYRDGKNYATLHLHPWHGQGVSAVLFDGPVDQLPAQKSKAA